MLPAVPGAKFDKNTAVAQVLRLEDAFVQVAVLTGLTAPF
jgi:hypothetical protein